MNASYNDFYIQYDVQYAGLVYIESVFANKLSSHFHTLKKKVISLQHQYKKNMILLTKKFRNFM